MACPQCGCKVTYESSVDDLDEEYDMERCSACGLTFYLMDAPDDDDGEMLP